MSELKKIFVEGMDDSNSPTWGRYPRSAWFVPSRAVVANDGGQGCVLHTAGPAVAMELNEIGRGLDDIGLDDAPDGISVWEGKLEWSPGSYEYPDDGDSYLDGAFRDPTEDEWAAISKNLCPWDESSWREACSCLDTRDPLHVPGVRPHRTGQTCADFAPSGKGGAP